MDLQGLSGRTACFSLSFVSISLVNLACDSDSMDMSLIIHQPAAADMRASNESIFFSYQ